MILPAFNDLQSNYYTVEATEAEYKTLLNLITLTIFT